MSEEKSKLQELLENHKNMDNEEIVKHIYGLESTFNELKERGVIIAKLMEEIQEVYNNLYDELNTRLKFEKSED